MKKISCAVLGIILTLSVSGAALGWDTEGVIYGTDIEYSGLVVSKSGVAVKLTNTSNTDVKVSLKLTFYGRNGSSLGYSIFGLREIQAGSYADISKNYLNGKWKECRDAARMEFVKMTYEPIYY
ncbi:MAG: hypothetical protein LBS53_10665 [Synergistaceae bacterium]|jgi:uncharacterized protein YxeA|nr:hypothetical protein [Synergistaceae bacterium]